MIQLRKMLWVAKQELGFDPRRLAAHAISGILPQHSFNRVRTLLLRALGFRIGAGSCFGGPVRVTGSGAVHEQMTIGPGCYITGPLHVDLTEEVRIGARVYMGYDVMLLTVDHDLGPAEQRCGPRVYRPICIEDGVWLGSRATVLPGVRIGKGSVVAAGAVVTRNVPPNTLVAGMPARPVRDLADAVADNARRHRLGANEVVTLQPHARTSSRSPATTSR